MGLCQASWATQAKAWREAAEKLHDAASKVAAAGRADVEAIDALGHEIRTIKENITTVVHNPLDVAAEKLHVPATLSILKVAFEERARISTFALSAPLIILPRSICCTREARRDRFQRTREGYPISRRRSDAF